MTLTKTQRFRILARDQFRCVYCGRFAPNVELEVDHMEPRAKGGTDAEHNLATACADCNRGKSDMRLPSPHDWTPTVRSETVACAWLSESLGTEFEWAAITTEDRASINRVDPWHLATLVTNAKAWARETPLPRRLAIYQLLERVRVYVANPPSMSPVDRWTDG